MRKVHYRVVLDILTLEDDGASGINSLTRATFWPEKDDDKIDIQDVTVESVEVIDPR